MYQWEPFVLEFAMKDDRPTLRIEQPPPEWIEQQQRKQEFDQREARKGQRRVVIIDMYGEESDDRDENGLIVIPL